MAIRLEAWHRLEPAEPDEDLGRGLAAETADPAWFVGRQWQLGEHSGADAASPVRADYRLATVAVTATGAGTREPGQVPLAAVVQRAPDEWWTPGRRIRVGAEVAALIPPALRFDSRLLLADLPEPYAECGGQVDGAAAWRHRDEPWLRPHLTDAVFAEVPPPPVSTWDAATLRYRAAVSAGTATLSVTSPPPGESGDWYHTDLAAASESPLPVAAEHTTVAVTRLRYPGAPHPRWWQLENAAVDIGGYAPDAAHFATALLLRLLIERSDDWYTFPVDLPVGQLASLQAVTVTDCFGDTWNAATPPDWSTARIAGLPPTTMLAWPACPTPLTGPEFERVDIAYDEDANTLWAVERRLVGRDVPSQAAAAQPGSASPEPLVPGQPPVFRYTPLAGAHPRWHPYVLDDTPDVGRRFVQARLHNPDGVGAVAFPEPEAAVLRTVDGGPHRLDPLAVPTRGLVLVRRHVLARDTSGGPVLWLRHEQLPLDRPVVSGLRHDVLEYGTAAG